MAQPQNKQQPPPRKLEVKLPTRPGMSQEEIKELYEAFKMFDTHNKGVIDTKELKDTMLSLGYQEKNKMILHMIRRIEKSGDSLNFEQFLNLMTAKIGGVNSREYIKRVFELFDNDDDGFISLDNLRKVAQELGEELTDDELKEMISRADTTGSNKVDFEEFYTIMNKKMVFPTQRYGPAPTAAPASTSTDNSDNKASQS